MSEPRKKHLDIDGAPAKEEEHEHVASYKPISETDQEFRTSKSSLGKSKEKVSADPAEEKLLTKEDEAKILPMGTEAKYDHRNGDTKIELDAAKKQFSGLTKEELLKYADDPFWVRLRWFMFVLFWALWLCMLAGAVAIIVRAPKCAAPTPKTWFELGPIMEYPDEPANYQDLEAELPVLSANKYRGLIITPCENTYQVLDEGDTCIENFKAFLKKCKDKSIKLIVDLTANFVPTSHPWFQQSESRAEGFVDYFTWNKSNEYDGTKPKVPNNWRTVQDSEAWSWSDKRQEYYLHQLDRPVPVADLNFRERAVVRHFDDVLRKWVDAGANGVRLRHARRLVVDLQLRSESQGASAVGTDHLQYLFYKHAHSADQPELAGLLAHWAEIVNDPESVFTIDSDGTLPAWGGAGEVEGEGGAGNATRLRPPPAARPAPLPARPTSQQVAALRAQLETATATGTWTMLRVAAEEPRTNAELSKLAMLLPATPLLSKDQLERNPDNNTNTWQLFGSLSELRDEPSVKFGERAVFLPPTHDNRTLLGVARWKSGQPGYVALLNPTDEPAHANLEGVPSLPAALTVHHASHDVSLATNYSSNTPVQTKDVLVPAYSTVVLSYVPKTEVDQ